MTKIIILILFFAISGICGKSRSIGGFDLTDTPFPHQASLRTFGHHICSGVIIDSKHILTSAQCLIGITGDIVDELIVVTGTNNLVSGQGNQHNADKIFIHEDYDRKNDILTGKNSIAIVRLQNEMKFDEHQNKISLTKSELSYRLNATVCGWNYFDYPIVIGNMVQQTLEVEILKKEECKKNNNGLSCAVYRQKINGCIENDNGSAIVSDGILIGFTVKKIPCDENNPVAFIDIFPFIAWIEAKLNIS